MRGRKPQRGSCSVCGYPVVAPPEASFLTALNERRQRFPYQALWLDGHAFDDAGVLVDVRCRKHGGRGFPDDSASWESLCC